MIQSNSTGMIFLLQCSGCGRDFVPGLIRRHGALAYCVTCYPRSVS